jgi:hypothetical protein
MVGERQVGLDQDPPGAVQLRPRELAEASRQPGRGDPRGPDHSARGHALRRSVGCSDGDRLPVDADHGPLEQGRDPEVDERAGCLSRQRRREARQHAVRGLHEQHLAIARVDGSKVVTQGVPGQLGDLSRHLHARGPRPDDDERQPRSPTPGVGFHLGRLEGAQDPPADLERALQRLHLRRNPAPLVVAEVGVPRAPGDDQGVVPDRRRARLPGTRLHPNLAGVQVEARDRGQEDPHVRPPLEDRSERVAHLTGGQRSRGHLIGEWLKEVEVAPVD